MPQFLASCYQYLIPQVLAALRARGSEVDAGLPQQAMQAEMAAFLVTHASFTPLLNPVWTTMLMLIPCLSECAVTAIADGASFKRDVIWKHESASGQRR